ncbi:MAG: dinitrogenase iron-molybdenum cofactor biosynthesis protein [Synechococcales bacterium]|nr:dinitrogenase iron-molybdenum cofactor biosynthesis protein [Synechococcales bacterium]
MLEQPISNEVALRIALASKLFPELTIADFIEALQSNLGDRLDEDSLSNITVTNLKTALGQTYELDSDEHGEDADSGDITDFKRAVRILWGELDDAEKLPPIEAYEAGDMPGSVRIAVASNSGEMLDGHFGSCSRYLIYQLSQQEMRLVDVRSALAADFSDDKNAFRVSLLRDCAVIYLMAIGGPAAAKVVQAGIYPIKKEKGGAARELLGELQHAIATSPPPWLAKILGVAETDRVKNYKAVAAH